MEIHPPHGAIQSKKDFLLHLLTITIGILIALSLEGAVTWIDHRSLARESRATLVLEISGNVQSLNELLLDLHREAEELQQIVLLARQLEEERNRSPLRFSFHIHATSLFSASWDVANSSGAITHMPYAEVRRYASLYQAQQIYAKHQEQERATLEELSGTIHYVLNRNPAKRSAQDIAELSRMANRAVVAEAHLEQEARQLSALYASFIRQNPRP